MKILRHVREDGKTEVLFYDGSRYFSPAENARQETAEDIIGLYRNLSGLELKEVSPPAKYGIPLPFSRLFLPAVNFRAHSEETKMAVPTEPYFFLKFPSSLVPHEGTVKLAPQIKKADYEGEIGIVIGKSGKYISKDDAMDYVFGYTIVDDVSLRDYQYREQPRFGKNWSMGKQFDDALPAGPWIAPADEIPEFRFGIKTLVNGETRQDGSTEDMIFSPAELISYLSEVNTLRPGDLISTGTPSGVGAHSGERYLGEGDRVEISVTNVGTLRHYITYR